MKIWLHVIAAVVGLALAALIVYLVFGNASQQGATQDGRAPSTSGGGTSLCGTFTAAERTSKAARTASAKEGNLPEVISPTGVSLTVARVDQPWFARMQAAGGFCVDEVRLLDGEAQVAMSTTGKVSGQDASAFTIGVLGAAFATPFDRPLVKVETFVGDERRSVVVSRRAWRQFLARGRSMGLGRSMDDLARFRRSTAFSDRDLKVNGWG